jgi:hypothetical protein
MTRSQARARDPDGVGVVESAGSGSAGFVDDHGCTSRSPFRQAGGGIAGARPVGNRARGLRPPAPVTWPIRWRRRLPGGYGWAPQPELTSHPQTYLRARRLLLVLDNFEDVVGPAPLLGELRRSLLTWCCW